MDYKSYWDALKTLLVSCYNETDENKIANEKELYKSILEVIEMYEKIGVIENENEND